MALTNTRDAVARLLAFFLAAAPSDVSTRCVSLCTNKDACWCATSRRVSSAKAGQNRTLAALEQRYAAFSQKHGFNLGGPVWRGANYAMGEMAGRSVKKLRSGRYNAYVYQTSSAAHQAYYHAVAAADHIGLHL